MLVLTASLSVETSCLLIPLDMLEQECNMTFLCVQDCIIEDLEKEGTEEVVEEKKRSSKKSSANGPDSRASTPNLSFKLSSKVPYKTLFKGALACLHSFC